MKKMICIGDSITAGFPYFENCTRWWEVVKQKLNIDVTEGSMSGSGFVMISDDLNCPRIVNKYNFKDFDVVVIAYGANDYGKNMEIGNIDDYYNEDNEINTVYGSINYVVKKILNENPNIKIIFSLPIIRKTALFGPNNSRIVLGNPKNKYSYGYKNNIGYTMDDYCNAIINRVNYYNLEYIDHKYGAFNVATCDMLLGDGLHPNKYGYIKLGEEMSYLLKGKI